MGSTAVGTLEDRLQVDSVSRPRWWHPPVHHGQEALGGGLMSILWVFSKQMTTGQSFGDTAGVAPLPVTSCSRAGPVRQQYLDGEEVNAIALLGELGTCGLF